MGDILIMIGITFILGAIVGGGLKYKDIIEIPVINSYGRQILLGLFGLSVILMGYSLNSPDDQIQIDTAITPANSTSTSPPVPTSTTTHTPDPVPVTNCQSRARPSLPCLFLVLSGDYLILVALEVYDDPAYSLAIMNFNRDTDGYRPLLVTGNRLYLPSRDEAPNNIVPIFKSGYPTCAQLGEKPCLYIAQEGDTYGRIAETYYGFRDAKNCLIVANRSVDPVNGEFLPLTEIIGKTLILPVMDPDC